MQITFLNQKGGVGKTTVSILLGGTLAGAGYAVAFDDRDEQGSLTWWARGVGMMPLLAESKGHHVVICDTPGRLDLMQNAGRDFLQPIIAASDRVVIVTEKSSFSLQATRPTLAFAKSQLKPGAKLLVLFNKVRASTKIGRLDLRQSADLAGAEVLETVLPLAAPYENVQTEGMTAVTGHHRELALRLALEILK